MQLCCWLGWHQWSEVQPVDARSCEQRRVCAQCGVTLPAPAIHYWSDWSYESPSGCLQERICIRCRNRETRMAHIHGARTNEGTLCERCGCLAQVCDDCHGTGKCHDSNCPACGGDGYESDGINGCWPCIHSDIVCSSCLGTGIVWQAPTTMEVGSGVAVA